MGRTCNTCARMHGSYEELVEYLVGWGEGRGVHRINCRTRSNTTLIPDIIEAIFECVEVGSEVASYL
jgi:hypothetical protein